MWTLWSTVVFRRRRDSDRSPGLSADLLDVCSWTAVQLTTGPKELAHNINIFTNKEARGLSSLLSCCSLRILKNKLNMQPVVLQQQREPLSCPDLSFKGSASSQGVYHPA